MVFSLWYKKKSRYVEVQSEISKSVGKERENDEGRKDIGASGCGRNPRASTELGGGRKRNIFGKQPTSREWYVGHVRAIPKNPGEDFPHNLYISVCKNNGRLRGEACWGSLEGVVRGWERPKMLGVELPSVFLHRVRLSWPAWVFLFSGLPHRMGGSRASFSFVVKESPGWEMGQEAQFFFTLNTSRGDGVSWWKEETLMNARIQKAEGFIRNGIFFRT